MQQVSSCIVRETRGGRRSSGRSIGSLRGGDFGRGPKRRPHVDIGQRRKPAMEALLGEDGEFDFRHVQPTRVLGSVVPDDTLQELFRTFGPESLDERLRVVRVEIVEDQMNPTRLGITLEQIANHPREVSPRAMPTDPHMPASSRGLHRHEGTAGAATAILVILLGDSAGSRRLSSADMIQHLKGLLVQADQRFRRIVWLFVLHQHVLHSLAELCRQLRHAPVFFRQGLRSCSRSHSETSLLLTAATKPCFAACSLSSSNVQRTRPWGGSLHANAMTRCCCFCVNKGGEPGRGASYTARSRPCKQKRFRTSRTVRSVQPTSSAICASVRPSSDFNRVWARRTTRTDRVPERTKPRNNCRTSSVRRMICSFMW